MFHVVSWLYVVSRASRSMSIVVLNTTRVWMPAFLSIWEILCPWFHKIKSLHPECPQVPPAPWTLHPECPQALLSRGFCSLVSGLYPRVWGHCGHAHSCPCWCSNASFITLTVFHVLLLGWVTGNAIFGLLFGSLNFSFPTLVFDIQESVSLLNFLPFRCFSHSFY